jgi:hypothetical protein
LRQLRQYAGSLGSPYFYPLQSFQS